MKMNLTQVRKLAGMPKPKFDARRRRHLHNFLHDSLSNNPNIADFENSQTKWKLQHVLALCCVDWFVDKHGVTVETADSVVENNFGELTDAVNEGFIDPEEDHDSAGRLQHFMIGRVSDAVGRAHVAGTIGDINDRILKSTAEWDQNSDGAFAGLILIDATAVYRQLKTRMIAGLGLV